MERPLKAAAISGILALVFGVLAFFPSILAQSFPVLRFVSMLFYIASFISSIFFYYGFATLGKRFHASLLQVMSWIFIVLAVVSALAYLAMFLLGLTFSQAITSNAIASITGFQINDLQESQFSPDPARQTELLGAIIAVFIAFLILFLLIVLILVALPTILFGIGLLKLEGKVENAKLIGVLDIVSGATMVVLVGFLIAPVSFILKIIFLWNASDKFEKRRFSR